MRFRREINLKSIVNQGQIRNYLRITYIIFLYLLILFASLNASARVAFLRENIYFNLGVGGFRCDQFKENGDIYIKNHPKIALLFTAGIGYMFSSHLRSAINFQYSKINYNANNSKYRLSQKIKAISGMLNLDYSLYPNSLINPYITAGIGGSRNDSTKLVETTLPSESKGKAKINFAWNIGCGVGLDGLSQNYSIDIGYKYVDLGKIYTKSFMAKVSDVSQRIKGHQVIVSVAFKF